MIAPDSASYPVRGAALATGIDYGLALAWVDCDYHDLVHVRAAIIESVGHGRCNVFEDLIREAARAGRVRVRRYEARR